MNPKLPNCGESSKSDLNDSISDGKVQLSAINAHFSLPSNARHLKINILLTQALCVGKNNNDNSSQQPPQDDAASFLPKGNPQST